MISIDDYSFTYPHAERPSLHHIHANIPERGWLGIIGPAGAGKTTMLYAIAGILAKFFPHGVSNGSLTFGAADGDDIQSIGFVFQDSQTHLTGITDTVEEEIAFALEQFGFPRETILQRIDEQIHNFGIDHLRHHHPRTLSGGESRIVSIAAEMAKHPQLLILDEPFEMLNKATVECLVANLRNIQNETTIVLSDTRLDRILTFVSHLLVLDNGEQGYFGTNKDLPLDSACISSIDIPAYIEVQRELGISKISRDYHKVVRRLKKEYD